MNMRKLNSIRKFVLLMLLVISIFTFAIGMMVAVMNIVHVQADVGKSENDYNFSDNSIIVTMSKDFGGINKKQSKNFFKGVTVSKIVDLTYVEDLSNYHPENFKQILKLEFDCHDKDYVMRAIKKINRIHGVEIAAPNYIGEIAALSNDTNYSKQWGLWDTNGIEANSAWDISTGSKDVRVGVIDTGIAKHEDLINNLAVGYNFVDNNLNTDDSNSHGTHVAGIIGAVGDNNKGITGVCKSVDIVPLKVAEGKSIATEHVISAINYAIKTIGTENQIDVLNLSAWNFPNDGNLYNAISNYKGLFVCIAGNGAPDEYGVNHGYDIDLGNNPNYPGSFDCLNSITVGAIRSDGKRSELSNYGKNTVDIYAPGENIYSTVLNNDYAAKSGTSMAAPYVAGVAALMLSVDPTLTGSQLKEMILSGTDTITIDTPSGTQTVKKLNAYKAMKQVEEYENSQLHRFFAGGMGSLDNPFIIQTEEQFRNIRYAYREVYETYTGNVRQINFAFKLESNIILQGDWTPFEYKFTGSFDGGGHSITYQTKISSGSITQEDIGLFGFITAYGEVKNLTLANCHITLGDDKTELTSSQYLGVGILAGSVYEGKITNVTIKNSSIFCNTTQSMVGGIAGSTNHSDLYNCVVTGGDFAAYNGNIGGMSGSGAIYNFHGGSCYATVTKYNYAEDDRVGKIVGNEGDACGEVTDNGITVNKVKKDSGTCIAEGTLITLADGRQVPVESLTGNESLLVWNLYTGTFDTAPILFIDKDASAAYKVINLAFSDGTGLKVISEHGLWDYNLNRYVYLDEDAAQYIGHWFNKQTTDGNVMTSSRVQLTGVTVAWEETAAYSPVTYGHLCYYVNGMLSMPGGIDGLFNIFAVDADTMQYDAAAMEADIAQYGLFTYEEFAQILNVPQEVYDAFNAQYFKVAIGKGIVTEARLAELATRYASQLGID